jgi:hypothetical protein
LRRRVGASLPEPSAGAQHVLNPELITGNYHIYQRVSGEVANDLRDVIRHDQMLRPCGRLRQACPNPPAQTAGSKQWVLVYYHQINKWVLYCHVEALSLWDNQKMPQGFARPMGQIKRCHVNALGLRDESKDATWICSAYRTNRNMPRGFARPTGRIKICRADALGLWDESKDATWMRSAYRTHTKIRHVDALSLWDE